MIKLDWRVFVILVLVVVVGACMMIRDIIDTAPVAYVPHFKAGDCFVFLNSKEPVDGQITQVIRSPLFDKAGEYLIKMEYGNRFPELDGASSFPMVWLDTYASIVPCGKGGSK